MRKLKQVIVGAVFMTVFGLVDNGFLLLGMEWFRIPDATINGMMGNMFSDGIGVIFGFLVSERIAKILGITEDKTTFAQQFSGIVIGCAIPIAIYAMF